MVKRYKTLAEYSGGEHLPLTVRMTRWGRLTYWVRRKILRQPDRPITITIYQTGVDPEL